MRVAQSLQIDKSIRVHRQIGDLETMLFQNLAAIQHRLVLGDAGDDVIALFAIRLGDAFDRQIIRLGGAAGKDNFSR